MILKQYLTVLTAAMAIMLASGAGGVLAQDRTADETSVQTSEKQTKPAKTKNSSNIDFRDHTLQDQTGKQLSFVHDVIGDNIIVMDFVYTACTTICPILSAVMEQVQDKLGDSLGKDVAMVSMTVDPTRDTPQRLKAYAAKHKSKPGWSWITGPKTAMDDVLTGLGAFSTNFEDHAPMVLVGDGHSGEWSRLYGFPNVERIIETVDALRVARTKMAGG